MFMKFFSKISLSSILKVKANIRSHEPFLHWTFVLEEENDRQSSKDKSVIGQ